MKGGYLATYIDKNGNEQKCRVMHADQQHSFAKLNKSFVRLCDDRFEDQLDANGKKLCSLVLNEKLKKIGYID